MTWRQVYEALLIETNKVQAPSVLLEDFNYFGNKAIGQSLNKNYNFYDITQQKSDDLRVLKSTAVLEPIPSNVLNSQSLFTNVFEVDLPDDYVHLLNCVVEYSVVKKYKCYAVDELVHFGAKRMTADMFPQLINNYYMRPSFKNPYYYINNVTTDSQFPTTDSQQPIFQYSDPINLHSSSVEWEPSTLYNVGDLVKVFDGADIVTFYQCTNQHTSGTTFLDAYFLLLGGSEKEEGTFWQPFMYTLPLTKLPSERYGNKSRIRMEIRYGKDSSIFNLSKVYIDYIKAPQYLQLTQEQVDEVLDYSQTLEFPDYVCQEIINELVKLLMENASDPRLQTNIPINQSIANQGQTK